MCFIDSIIAICCATCIITSGHRTIDHNREVGGAKNSYHLQKCGARDLVPKKEDREHTIKCLLDRGLRVIDYPIHLHTDIGDGDTKYWKVRK